VLSYYQFCSKMNGLCTEKEKWDNAARGPKKKRRKEKKGGGGFKKEDAGLPGGP
jgi:hypothetical protein